MNKLLRELCLTRANNKCELCGSQRKLEVHHIIPIVANGDDDKDNLIVLCEKCHGILTPKSYLTRYGQKKKTLAYAVTKELLECDCYEDAYLTLLNFCVENYWSVAR